MTKITLYIVLSIYANKHRVFSAIDTPPMFFWHCAYNLQLHLESSATALFAFWQKTMHNDVAAVQWQGNLPQR